MNTIEIQHLTKDYGQGKGVFDVSLSINKGEVYGYLGPNGSGKSTTMRHLMGFSKPQRGIVHIQGLDCWTEQKTIQNRVGYLPGEISFPDDMTGLAYLKLIAKMRKMEDFSYADQLADFFEIDPRANIKRMSKGMKQKIGIIAAFMHNPDILLLDEPTSGLDPLMQNRFIDLVEEEKQSGKTILLSSHIFAEVEKTCDRIGMIRKGRLIQEVTVDELRHAQVKTYTITLSDQASLDKLKDHYPQADYKDRQKQVTLSINDREINQLLALLATCQVASLQEEKTSLEDYFMQFYGVTQNDEHPLL